MNKKDKTRIANLINKGNVHMEACTVSVSFKKQQWNIQRRSSGVHIMHKLQDAAWTRCSHMDVDVPFEEVKKMAKNKLLKP